MLDLLGHEVKTMAKHYHHESFGETLEYAASLGFDEDGCEDDMIRGYGLTPGEEPVPGHLQCEISDCLEEAAIEHLRSIGITVTGYDDCEEEEW